MNKAHCIILQAGIHCRISAFLYTAVLKLLLGVLLFSATIFVDATQTEKPPTREQQTDPNCLDDGQKPEPGLICPNPRTPCPRNEG